MGQTLTHGVYLPDEGERNCYSGLASNWQILDTSVGTIAAHTSALAGKAPLVHTHTKSDITDFPAYGTTAGTICEGNDSRLSDARTPVAHTHTKSDVTDLLNSDFIPSANKSYNLGSSSYQWNNLYAKNYFYNGVAWGLDKNNTWPQINDFKTLRLYGVASNNLVMYPPSGEKGDSSTFSFNIICCDKNLGTYAASGVANIGMGQSGGTSYVALNTSTKGSTDNNIHSIQIGLQIAAADNANIGSFYPTQNGGINLGTSTNKWKSLNGVNPGALSLPNLDSDGYIDLSDNISANSEYLYTPVYDGWLALYCQTTGFHAENAVAIFSGGGSSSAYRWACSATSAINLSRQNSYHGAVILPVKAGRTYLCYVIINSSTTLSFKRLYFYKATGNV